MNSLDNQFFNPEDLTQAIMNKSFLHKRQSKRQKGSGSQFFKNNGIRSCSYVKQTKEGLKAIPYYDKRNNSVLPTNSDTKRSWTSCVHSNKGLECAGMGSKKPLLAYNQKATRSLMNVPDFKPPYPNSSHIEFGTRSVRDSKHYQTTYRNDLIHESKQIKTNNPAIQAFKNKWLRSRLQK